MQEIDPATAQADGYYVEELADPRRFHRYSRGRLESLIYPGWSDPAEPIADMRRRNLGVRGEIYSPVEYGNVSKRWRTWFVNANGNIERILEPELDENGRFLRENYRGPDGELRSYRVYDYNDWGELIEVVTYAPDGTVINREE